MASALHKAAVIGHPIKHSLSPVIFTALAKKSHIQLEYKKLDIRPSHLASFVSGTRKDRPYVGLSITIPHKESITSNLDVVSQDASLIGAVNVVTFKSHRSYGINTDTIGIYKSFQNRNFPLKNRNILLIGTGGTAKAAAYTFGKHKASSVLILSRTPRKAKKFCSRFSKVFPNTYFRPYTTKTNLPIDLFINATPIGMLGFKSLDLFEKIDFSTRSKRPLAMDMIYTTAVTPFMKLAQSFHIRSFNGLDMLIFQALATWETWFGRMTNRDELFRNVKTLLRKQII